MDKNIIRCFIAVSLPLQILDQIGLYLSRLRNTAPQIRWVRPAGIHITLKFLAEQPAAVVKNVAGELADVGRVCPPFQLQVAGTGCFPNKRKPRVFWLGLEHDKNNSLFRLHEWIDTKLEPLGFEREKRRFSPHLTLGRVKDPSHCGSVFDFLAENPFNPLKFVVQEVGLIQSELRPEGAKYTTINSYLLRL